LKKKPKKVYVTHKLHQETMNKLDQLSQLTGTSMAELLEQMINEKYAHHLSNTGVNQIFKNDKVNENTLEQDFDHEPKANDKQWKYSNKELDEFNQKMEYWKNEEKMKNSMQAEKFKKKLDDWAKEWERYFRDYSFTIKENHTYQYKYFNPKDGAEVWKKHMRQYTRLWHPDYAQNEGNPQKFGEMKAEYDILTGKIPTEEYSL